MIRENLPSIALLTGGSRLASFMNVSHLRTNLRHDITLIIREREKKKKKHKPETSFELLISFNYLKIIAIDSSPTYRKGNTINRQEKATLRVCGENSQEQRVLWRHLTYTHLHI